MLHSARATGQLKLENGVAIEIIMAAVVLATWIMALPVVTAPDNHLAVSVYRIINANLYFSTWGSFFAALYIAESVGSERFPCTHTVEASWTKQWVLLLISSSVTLISCVQLNQRKDCTRYFNFNDPRSTDYCQDLQIAVLLSGLSAGMALVLALLLACMALLLPPRRLFRRTFVLLLNFLLGRQFALLGHMPCLPRLGDGPASVVCTTFSEQGRLSHNVLARE